MIEVIDVLCRLFLAFIFILSGGTKIVAPQGTKKAVEGFGFSSKLLANWISIGLPIVELCIALLLLFSITAFLGALLSVTLLLIFNFFIIRLIKQGKQIDCHCFGELNASPTGWNTVIRNTGLLLFSLVPILQSKNSVNILCIVNFTNEQWIYSILFIIIFLQGFVLISLLNKNESIQKRFVTLEEEVFRGLPLGSKAPDFELLNSNGEITTLQKLLALNKPLLFLFFDPDCGPCAALLQKAIKWHEEYENRLRIVFIGRSSEKNDLLKTIPNIIFLTPLDTYLAQKVYKTRGFPSAIAISKQGFIDSFPAAGEEGVVRLLKKLL